MPSSLFEQFLAVGSVKSLLTGKEFSPPATDEKTTTDQKTQPAATPQK